MTYIRYEKPDDYELGDKIRENEDGSSLYYAKRKKNGNSFFVRINKDSDAPSKTRFENEKVALQKPGKLKPYVHPIYSSFSADGKNYTVYKHIGHLFGTKDVQHNEEEDESNLKALISQFFIYLRKASKINSYPVENSSVENMSFYEGKISLLGFENAIPLDREGSKNGITTDVTKIAKDDIGLKSSYIKAASFMHYVFTGKSAITSSGIKINKNDIDDKDALDLINECIAEKSSDEFKEFNPFKSEYLSHKPKIECAMDHFTIDDLTFSWEDGFSISIGEVELSIDLGESAVTVKEGDNEIEFGSDGVTIKGEYEGITGTFIGNVTIDADGLRMGGENAYVTINSDGLYTGSSTRGRIDEKNTLKITSDGLEFDGTGDAKLTLGENFEYSPLDLFTPKFGNPFQVKSKPLTISLSSSDLGISLLEETDITITKTPSLNIASCGTLISLNEGSPISISVGAAVVFEFTGRSINLTMSGVDITFEDGTLRVDNDVVAITLGKAGTNFFTYGVPFDMKAYKDQLTFPDFKFQLPDIKIPGIPGLPSIPKPGGMPDLGGCCSIF